MNKNFNPNFYRQKILFLLKHDKEELAKKIITQVAKNEYLQSHNFRWLYNFFSPIFDELFYDLIFKKIEITTSTKELLEKLSLPLFKMDERDKQKLLDSIK